LTSDWWSPEEKQAAQRQLKTLAAAADIINSEVPNLYNYVNWKCFKRGVLDKYRDNELCHVDDNIEYISFLDNDDGGRKTPTSTAKFYHTNVEDTIALQTHSYLGIPPREKSHWQQHEIPLKFV
jgi:hypothetical protein